MENVIYEYITQKGMAILKKWQRENTSSKKIVNQIYYDFFANKKIDDNTKLAYIYALNFRIKKRYNTFLKRFFRYFSYKKETELFSKLKVIFKNDNDVINELFMQSGSVNISGGTSSGKNGEDKKDKEKEVEKVQNKEEEKDELQINNENKNLEKEEEKEIEIDKKQEKIKENKKEIKDKNIAKEKIKENKLQQKNEKIEKNEKINSKIPNEKSEQKIQNNFAQKESDFRVPINIDITETKTAKSVKTFQSSNIIQTENIGIKQTSNESKTQVVFFNNEFEDNQTQKNINTYTDYAMNHNPVNRPIREVDTREQNINDTRSINKSQEKVIDENVERQKINDKMSKLTDEEVIDLKTAIENTIKRQLDVEEQLYKRQKEKVDIKITDNKPKEKTISRSNTVRQNTHIKINK